jgi:molecular chaperone GrpE
MMPREPEEQEHQEIEDTQPDNPDTADAKAAVAALQKELAEAKKQAEENLAAWQRTQADFSNYRRRMVQEQQDRLLNANASLFCDILPVLDDLELAINHIPEEHTKSKWVEGVRLVERKFKSILEKQGVKPILTLGMAFDPKLHEAIKQEKGPEGAVIAEVQKGYTLNGRLIRPSRVIVGSGEKDEAKPEVEPEQDAEDSNVAE